MVTEISWIICTVWTYCFFFFCSGWSYLRSRLFGSLQIEITFISFAKIYKMVFLYLRDYNEKSLKWFNWKQRALEGLGHFHRRGFRSMLKKRWRKYAKILIVRKKNWSIVVFIFRLFYLYFPFSLFLSVRLYFFFQSSCFC